MAALNRSGIDRPIFTARFQQAQALTIHQPKSTMARRASSSLHPGILIGLIAAIAAAIFAGKSFIGKKPAAFENVAVLDVRELLENGNSLRGNDYVIHGEIDEKLQWTSDRGQVVSVKVDTPGGPEFVGIRIPVELAKLNLETRQKYSFKVNFQDGGIAVATGVNRL
jgi:hypothetical protein